LYKYAINLGNHDYEILYKIVSILIVTGKNSLFIKLYSDERLRNMMLSKYPGMITFFLSRSNQHTLITSENYKKQLLEMIGESNNCEKLRFHLSQVLSLISLSKYNDKSELWKEIYDQKELYSNCFDWGYILRISEEIFDNFSSMEYIRKSILFFKERNQLIEMLRSKITLSAMKILTMKNHADILELKETLQSLEKEFREIQTSDKGLHTNLALIMIFENISVEANEKPNSRAMIEKHLYSALSLSFNDLSYLLAFNNIFAYKILTNSKDSGFNLEELIHLSEISNYGSARITSFYNLAKYYQEKGQQQQYNRYLERIWNELKYIDDYRKNYWLHKLKDCSEDCGYCKFEKGIVNPKELSYVGLLISELHFSPFSVWDFSPKLLD
ncbi:hypothetical protein CI105_09260, partial [Candidatus Izimaplasma bacterium ZiA1]|uniref:hypothetical protein n=1 Tax=Candidatus Izimoplasma sp. ZiA1 TaxID=2024899 RepID=UPI000BDC47B7